MDKAYRLILSRAKDAWVIAAEIVKGNGGLLSVTVSALIVAAFPAFATKEANALPTTPTVINGTATFVSSGKNLTITNSPNSIINWQGFSIAAGERTTFLQQNAASAVLNRVTGTARSEIFGILDSNGRVFLLNPNGILFGAGSQINVAGLVASSLGMDTNDFLNGDYRFSKGNQAGSVINEGVITTAAGGKVWLIAPQVANRENGVISAANGDILLAAGQSVHMVDPDNPEISVVISAPADQVLNLGTITAQAGKVGIFAGLLNQQGVISANSAVAGPGGRVTLSSSSSTRLGADSFISADALEMGNGGRIAVLSDGETMSYGTLSAVGGANGGNGGVIETSGHFLDFAGVRVNASAPKGKAGTWLLDPVNVTINAQEAAAIMASLDNANPTDVTVTTSAPGVYQGNIYVYSDIAWTSEAALALTADSSVRVNSQINGGGPLYITGKGTNNLHGVPGVLINQPVSAADISLIGTGGKSGVGVSINNAISASGNITISGQGGISSSGYNGGAGVSLNAPVSSKGFTSITGMGGVGGSASGGGTDGDYIIPKTYGRGGFGIATSYYASILSEGAVTLTGSGGDGSSQLNGTGGGAGATGISITYNASIIGNGGSITAAAGTGRGVTASPITIASGGEINLKTGANLTLTTTSAGIPISVGTGTSGGLAVTANKLPAIGGGISGLQIGDELHTGLIKIDGPFSPGIPLSILTRGGIDQLSSTFTITAPSLTATAGTGIDLSGNNALAAANLINTDSGMISLNNSNLSGLLVSGSNSAAGAGFTIKENLGPLAVAGLITNNGAIALNSARDVSFNNAVNAGTGDVTVTSGGAINGISGANTISAGSTQLNAQTGIGATAPIQTAVSQLGASNSSNPVQLANTGELTVTGITNGGAVLLDNKGAMTLAGQVLSTGSTVTITAHSPLTISRGADITGDGNVTLFAGASGSPLDNLLVDGNVTSLSQDILLKAGNQVSGNGRLSAPNGKISIQPNLNSAPPVIPPDVPPDTSLTPQTVMQLPEVSLVVNNSLATMGSEAGKLDSDDKLEKIEPSEGDYHGTEFRALPYCN